MVISDARWLWALWALVPLVLLEWRAVRRARTSLALLVGDRAGHALLAQLVPRRRRLSIALRLGALTALVLGAAGPEWGREVVRRAATGSDVLLVLDVSSSMDARDVLPSRLEEARREALTVLDHLQGSRVGIVAFAGDAIRLCPLTLDRGAARLTLESLTTTSVSEPGTDLGKALRLAVKVMPGGRREEQAVLLWTDGEDLEQGARTALDEAARSGVRIFTVGVGTPNGDVVPVLDDQGRATDVKRDENGNVVRSRLDEDLLRAVARRTRGAYFGASRPGGELPRLLASLGALGRSSRGARLVERPVARFPLAAAIAFTLLLADVGMLRRRRDRDAAGTPPAHSETGAAAAVLLALLGTCGTLVLAPAPARAQSAWAKGDQAFRRGRWAEAESLYAQRLAHGGPDEVRVNRATARAERGDTTRAEAELARLAAGNTRAGRVAGYNLGTVQGERKVYDPALSELRRVLERDPADADARWNYEVLLARRERDRHAPEKPPEQKPRSGGQGGGGGGNGSPPPGQTPPQAPAPAQQAPTPPSMGQSGTMDRAQAERLLGALEEMARLDQQRQHKVRVMREKRGKDW